MQFSDFSRYLSTHAWEQCKLHSSGMGQKARFWPVSTSETLVKLKPKKWTISHNHRKTRLCWGYYRKGQCKGQWSPSPSYPETSFTHTSPNDFPSRTDATLELPALINSCLHSGSINTQPFEGNCIGWFNYCNPITFTSFPHSNVSVMEVIRKILIRLKYRPAV